MFQHHWQNLDDRKHLRVTHILEQSSHETQIRVWTQKCLCNLSDALHDPNLLLGSGGLGNWASMLPW